MFLNSQSIGDQLKNGGISFNVRYVGCIEIKCAMKSLDFETRSLVAKHSINKICKAAGFCFNVSKCANHANIEKKIGENPIIMKKYAMVTLTITSNNLFMICNQTNTLILNHAMPNISFASGGDLEASNFVAYIAKDEELTRACYVVECKKRDLARKIIAIIGQAFEIRFKQHQKYQKKPLPPLIMPAAPTSTAPTLPTTTSTVTIDNFSLLGDDDDDVLVVGNGNSNGHADERDDQQANLIETNDEPDMFGQSLFSSAARSYGGTPCLLSASTKTFDCFDKFPKKDYYNDFPIRNATLPPPLLKSSSSSSSLPLVNCCDDLAPVAKPFQAQSQQQSDAFSTAANIFSQSASMPLVDMSSSASTPLPTAAMVDTSDPFACADTSSTCLMEQAIPLIPQLPAFPDIHPFSSLPKMPVFSDFNDFRHKDLLTEEHEYVNNNLSSTRIIFDMRNFILNSDSYNDLEDKLWYHGKISRQEAENLLCEDGDFLVRKSLISENQYILSGIQGDLKKHLLLVDPFGQIRTKEKVFESISHLIYYHCENALPIISTESALLLCTPITRKNSLTK